MKLDQEKSLVIDIDSRKKKVLSPYCIKNKKIFYLFFAITNDDLKIAGNTKIYLASSSDFQKWKINYNPVIKNFALASHRVLSPSIVSINNYFYMVFEGRDKKTSSIFFAKSNDLINWNIEKLPLLCGNGKINFHSPFITINKNKQICIYYCKKVNNKSNIQLNIYKNTKFHNKVLCKKILDQSQKYENYSIYAPTIIKNKSKWLMLYAAWSKHPIKGRIVAAISNDGINWKKKKNAVIEPSFIYDIKHCSEPSIIIFKRQFYVFYEGSDKNGRWRILKTKITGFE